MICKTCQDTGEILEYCCNGRDCACKGKPQFKQDCPDCIPKREEINEDRQINRLKIALETIIDLSRMGVSTEHKVLKICKEVLKEII